MQRHQHLCGDPPATSALLAKARSGTNLPDVPLHLIEPYLHVLDKHERLALFQTCKGMRGLVLANNSHVHFMIIINQHSQPKHPESPDTAAWAVSRQPATGLRLLSPITPDSTAPHIASAIESAVKPSVGQFLKSLGLKGLTLDSLVPAAVAASCLVLQHLMVKGCILVAAAPTTTSTCSLHPCLQHLGIMHTNVPLLHLAVIAHLPSLNSLTVTWPHVPVQCIPGAAAAQITSLTVAHNGEYKAKQTLLTAATSLTMLQSLELRAPQYPKWLIPNRGTLCLRLTVQDVVAKLQAAAANVAKAAKGMLLPEKVEVDLRYGIAISDDQSWLTECCAAMPLLQGFMGELVVLGLLAA